MKLKINDNLKAILLLFLKLEIKKKIEIYLNNLKQKRLN